MDPQNRFQIKSWTCPLAEEPSPVASSYQAAQVSLLSLAALKLQNDLLISLCRIAQLSPEPLCGPPRHVPIKHPTCRAFPRPSVMTHIHCLLPVVCMPRPPPSKGRHPRVSLEFFITVFLSFMWSRICPDQPCSLIWPRLPAPLAQRGWRRVWKEDMLAQVGTGLVSELGSPARCLRPARDNSHSPDELGQLSHRNGPARGLRGTGWTVAV